MPVFQTSLLRAGLLALMYRELAAPAFGFLGFPLQLHRQKGLDRSAPDARNRRGESRRSNIAPCRSNELSAGSERLVQRQKSPSHSCQQTTRLTDSTAVTVAKGEAYRPGVRARANWRAGYGARAANAGQ